jgi:uncharacterized repeat protein (TIGR01451 family)
MTQFFQINTGCAQTHHGPRPTSIKVMRPLKIPMLLLAVVLNCAPICRLACPILGAPPAGFAIVFRCLAGAAALLGSYHATSGASALIAGVANTNPPGPVSDTATGQVNRAFSYQIVVRNAGEDPDQAYFYANRLPAGLTIKTNVGGDGMITGTPTTEGTSLAILYAGNVIHTVQGGKDVQKTILFSILRQATSPPLIQIPPADQIAAVGSTVTLAVTANGSDLSYQWRFNATDLSNGTNATLILRNVTTNQSGSYSVRVSNTMGNADSEAAQLLVAPPLGPEISPHLSPTLLSAGQMSLSFQQLAGYAYQLETSETLAAGSWIPLTKLPPSLKGSTVSFPQSVTPAVRRFYRVQVNGP